MSGPAPTAYEHVFGEEYPETYGIVRHLVDFLRWRFNSLPTGAYHYSDEELDSQICITADAPIDPIKIGQRPAITVLRSHAVFQGVGIGDRAFVDWQTGAQVYMDLIPTTVMINVLSKIDIEAESLAMFCAKQIRAFRDAIVQGMPELLYLGQRIGLSPPSPPGQLISGDSPDTEWVCVVVSIPVFLQNAITVLPLNKTILKGVGARFTTTNGDQ